MTYHPSPPEGPHIHNTKEDYLPSASFRDGETRVIWDKLLQERRTPFAAWLSTLDQDLKDHLETVFYDEVMIRPLVKRLGQDDDPELLKNLLYIATTRMSRVACA